MNIINIVDCEDRENYMCIHIYKSSYRTGRNTKNLIEWIKIELIGLGTVAHDIVLKYRFLGKRTIDVYQDSTS